MNISHVDNSKHTFGLFTPHGMFVAKVPLIANKNIDGLHYDTENSEIFYASYTKRLFNENKEPEISTGRYQVQVDSLFALLLKKRRIKNQQSISNIVTDSRALAEALINDINNKLRCNICLDDFIASVLMSMPDTPEQKIHCDGDFDFQYGPNMLVCIVAIEDNTNIRVVKGSHLFSSYEDLTAPLPGAKKKMKFKRSQLVTLNKGEYLVFHPKLIHGGWSSVTGNTRMHFYFGMRGLSEELQHSTCFVEDEDLHLFDDTDYLHHIYNIAQQGYDAKAAHVAKKLANFNGK